MKISKLYNLVSYLCIINFKRHFPWMPRFHFKELGISYSQIPDSLFSVLYLRRPGWRISTISMFLIGENETLPGTFSEKILLLAKVIAFLNLKNKYNYSTLRMGTLIAIPQNQLSIRTVGIPPSQKSFSPFRSNATVKIGLGSPPPPP